MPVLVDHEILRKANNCLCSSPEFEHAELVAILDDIDRRKAPLEMRFSRGLIRFEETRRQVLSAVKTFRGLTEEQLRAHAMVNTFNEALAALEEAIDHLGSVNQEYERKFDAVPDDHIPESERAFWDEVCEAGQPLRCILDRLREVHPPGIPE